MYGYLLKAELGTIFALPWLITWFGHVLPDYGDVVRLYDFFMAQPPLMPVYLAAAIVLYKKVMPICQSHRSFKAATVTIKRMGSADLVVKLGCNALHLKNKENISLDY